MLNAVILAGKQPLSRSNEAGNKALLMINGKHMIDYVVDVLQRCERIGQIVIVGESEEFQYLVGKKVKTVVRDEGSMLRNAFAGIEYLGEDRDILICTSDIPMITVEAIDDFIVQSEASGAELCYPIVDKRINDMKFPYIERTYARMKEGSFTGGNLIYIKPNNIKSRLDMAEKLINARKSPLKLARILKVSFLIQLITGTLSIPKVEKRFSELLGIHAKAIQSTFPEVGNDVDKPSDMIIAKKHISASNMSE